MRPIAASGKEVVSLECWKALGQGQMCRDE
jgi:hypothetical protein